MPTAQIQQPRSVQIPRRQYHDYSYVDRSCSCQDVPTLTTKVSKLTLRDGKTVHPTMVSSIVQPSRGFSPTIKTTRVFFSSMQHVNVESSSVHSSKEVLSETRICKTRAPPPISTRRVSPTRNPSRLTKPENIPSSNLSLTNNNQIRTRKTPNNSSLSKKLANVSISGKKVYYDTVSVQREDSSKRNINTSSTNTKYSQSLNTFIKNFSNNQNQLLSEKSGNGSIQLLHPGWRRVPWKQHFGWTDSHQELCKLLRQEIKKGSVDSIFYSSEEQYALASRKWRNVNKDFPFLNGPSASTVSEVLDVIKKMNDSKSQWVYTGSRVYRWNSKDAPGLSEYDADDED